MSEVALACMCVILVPPLLSLVVLGVIALVGRRWPRAARFLAEAYSGRRFPR